MAALWEVDTQLWHIPVVHQSVPQSIYTATDKKFHFLLHDWWRKCGENDLPATIIYINYVGYFTFCLTFPPENRAKFHDQVVIMKTCRIVMMKCYLSNKLKCTLNVTCLTSQFVGNLYYQALYNHPGMHAHAQAWHWQTLMHTHAGAHAHTHTHTHTHTRDKKMQDIGIQGDRDMGIHLMGYEDTPHGIRDMS